MSGGSSLGRPYKDSIQVHCVGVEGFSLRVPLRLKVAGFQVLRAFRGLRDFGSGRFRSFGHNPATLNPRA